MNYKLQIHFLNDLSMWRAHISGLINMNIIKSPYLHQCRLDSNGNGFFVVQKTSSNLQETYHLGFTCQQDEPCLESGLGVFLEGGWANPQGKCLGEVKKITYPSALRTIESCKFGRNSL